MQLKHSDLQCYIHYSIFIKYPEIYKESQIRVLWYVPVIPATQEAEAEELPEPRRQRLRWAKIAPLHSSLGNKSETPSKKKKEKPNTSWI